MIDSDPEYEFGIWFNPFPSIHLCYVCTCFSRM